MCRRILLFVMMLTVPLAACGCGSKISEANYYRVHYGMTEDEVEDVLGPPHEITILPAEPSTRPSTAEALPASTRPVERKQLTWSREGITLRIILTGGTVTARSAEGIPGEKLPPGPATAPLAPDVRKG